MRDYTPIEEINMNYDNKNLLQFHELEENTFYRVLHAGQRDHGYNYKLVNGQLFNHTKNKLSSLGFNKSIRFISTDLKIMSFPSLDHDIEFHSRGLKIGCQDLSIIDAKEIAYQILDRY